MINDFSQAKVLVVGDVMLDRYWFGDVSRISPEAPVPIANIKQTEHRAGGAANVARNIASLGGQVALLSRVGDDEAGTMLTKLLMQDGVKNYLQRSQQCSTTLKLRVLARHQQLIRLDFEDLPDNASLIKIQQHYVQILADYDVVILSDYGKGILREVQTMIKIARNMNKPVLIDPKGNDYNKYANATLITPNRTELAEVVGNWDSEGQLTKKAQILRQQLNLEALLLTRSEEGMSLYQADKEIYQNTRAQEVYDVSGAGDTVIATMGLCLAAGKNLQQAMHIANVAAGVVVAKLGTAVCTYTELKHALQEK